MGRAKRFRTEPPKLLRLKMSPSTEVKREPGVGGKGRREGHGKGQWGLEETAALMLVCG